MGTVGISFGNPTGGAGFDVTTTVAAIVSNLEHVETPWKTQLTSFTAQDAVFTSLGSNLSTLSADIQTLTDPAGVLANKEGSSSDTSVLTLTSASSTAVAGTHTVLVNSLAQTSTADTAEIGTTDVLTGGVAIQVGSGTAQTINVGSTQTLAGLSAAINAAGIGVTANVITDTNGSRLSIVSGTGGVAGQLTVSSTLVDGTKNVGTTGSPALALTTIQAGVDASLKVDGFTVTSGTNTVSDAIPGVTFQLLADAPSEPVQVVITNNASAVTSALTTFVSDYNTTINAITAQEGNTSSGTPEPLYGSPILARLQEQLQSALSSKYSSGTINSLAQLGVEAQQNGTITLNSDTLTTILNSNYSGVSEFFQNTGTFGVTFSTLLNNLSSSNPSGTLDLALAEDKSEETTLNKNVSNEEAVVATQKTNLTNELNTANQELQAIPEQLQEVNELYSAITGYNQTHS
ncbi:Flagellar hook-associated protein FliD [Acidisarcina polymorpha]|uniref:Flagellar hook-associated protein 2 n=1 Tax=Acidisarcina polymorpha TaxID=2211140 RepID=A0A2Z5G7Q2_9BACT|nr:flagellar filament capping protein FliD [Acidisarcina polymorpha]AXC14837.1 Flagellar hook-associated protein FliD [Acidisarcina polymorpha]